MTHIVIVNPNTTASMTAKIDAAARSVAAAGTVIEAVTPKDGPDSIEGYYDEVFAVPAMLREMAARPAAAGYIVACFDDTGVQAARSLLDAPVVGIGEAGFQAASLIAPKFSVVTTLLRSIDIVEHNLVRCGLSARCAKVRAADVPVLALEDPQSNARTRVVAEVERARDEDGAGAVVLGCAGMADLARSLTEECGLPVVEGVGAAVKLVEGLSALGLRTSKRGAYATPREKQYRGSAAEDAPQALWQTSRY